MKFFITSGPELLIGFYDDSGISIGRMLLSVIGAASRDLVERPPSIMSFQVLMALDHGSIPVGMWCQNDVVSTSMRRHHVVSTLIRPHFYVMCPLG